MNYLKDMKDMDKTPGLHLSERRNGKAQYGRVYGDSKARFSTPFGSRRPICYGDRLFARIVMRGRTVLEFMVNQVCDLTEFWGELRKKAKGLKGLVQVHIRNYSRGWSMQQPMMLYAPAATQPSMRLSAAEAPQPERRMFFPWES